MHKYLDQSLDKYLNDLASNQPAPGGGSASALAASTGISLFLMVANFTLNKKGYEVCQEEVKKIVTTLSELKTKMNILIDEDVIVYQQVSLAYKLPKNTEEEKNTRASAIESVSKTAMSVPWKIMEGCLDAAPYASRLSEIGNNNLISDIYCGAEFIQSAFNSAVCNIEINLKNIKDSSFVSQHRTIYSNKSKLINSQISVILKKTGGFIAF
ncbi:MAG: hypothetical protein A2252_06995 [Elusimicrobia bacterium RIFOXYA2_FULL_39_19]|nr:MAG: hypothetical protein A2252_06995 [Elusimicrobia bacterium RIFOXYA2_FULL_39_19]